MSFMIIGKRNRVVSSLPKLFLITFFILLILPQFSLLVFATCNDYYAQIEGQISCAEDGQLLQLQVSGCPRANVLIEQETWSNYGPVYIFGDAPGYQEVSFYLDDTLIETREIEFFAVNQNTLITNHDIESCDAVTTTESPQETTTTTSTPSSGIVIVLISCITVLVLLRNKKIK